MRIVIPFAPWQTSYFLRWLRDMSRQGWELKTIKGAKAVFAPAVPASRQYALFPENAAPQEIDELFRRIEEGSITVPPALERPMPSRLALPEDPRLAKLVGEIGPYRYIQLIYQIRRENGWENVCDWGSFSVMRQTSPDALPPPPLEPYIADAKKNQKGQNTSNAVNLGCLLVTPVLTLLKGSATYAPWQKILFAVILLTIACFVVYLLLFRRVLAPEKWDMPYEECLRRMARLTILSYVVSVGAAVSAFVFPTLSLMML